MIYLIIIIVLVIALNLIDKYDTMCFIDEIRDEIINRQDIKKYAYDKMASLEEHRDEPHGNTDTVLENKIKREQHVIETMNAQIKTLRFIALYNHDYFIRRHGRKVMDFDKQVNAQMLTEHDSLADIYDKQRLVHCNDIYRHIKRLDIIKNKLTF